MITHPMTRAFSTVFVVNADLGTCACCDTECSSATLAPLATDFTYDRAVRQYSFERDDRLCQGCRDAFEAEFGRDEYDAGDDCHD